MPIEGRQLLEEEQRVAQENISRMWLELKVPSRDKIQKYAQEFIHQTWSDGRGVTKATASKFAAEVLCHVRQRFDEVIAQEDRMLALKGTAFPQDADSQACRKLKLEDMKWAFEEYVKPYTERFGKDLFLCRVCDTNQKLFSFEAVIQHYAAKHTSALSHGNAVVYWKAPWPIDPPFDPSPNIPWVHEGLHYSGQPISTSQPPVKPGYVSTGGYQTQVAEIAALALASWDRLDGIWDLTDPVRLYVVIQHINLRCLKEFNDELSLPLFTDMVLQRPELQSIRDLLGLRCKICSELSRTAPAQLNGRHGSWYSLPELLTHFLRDHLHSDGVRMETGATPFSSWAPANADWTRDMLWLPSPAAIQALLHSPGIDRDKLQLIAEAFPTYFPYPLPYVGPSPPIRSHDEAQNSRSKNAHYYDRKKGFTGQSSVRGSGDGSYIATSEGSGITAEDEYDPHRPAPTFKRPYPQESRYMMHSPPRNRGRYGDLPSYPARSPVYPEYYFRDADYSPVWDLHSREGPLSGASMVYSHEDGSSRFSYLEPLNRNSETTVEGTSEAIPGSKAASRQSLPLAVDTETPAVSRGTEGQRSRQHELVSNAAADFLNNFDPTCEENAPGSDVDLGALHVRHTEQNHSDPTQPRPTARRSQENQPASRPSTRLGDNHPPVIRRHTPSLPIRQSARPDLTSDYQRFRDPSSTFLEEDRSGTSRVLVAEHEYMVGLPEGSHRVQMQGTSAALHDRVVACAGTQYETRYYTEDDYFNRSGRRYELIDTLPAEASMRPFESGPPRYIDSHLSNGPGYDDSHRRHRHGGDSHEAFPSAAPQSYPHTGEEFGAQSYPERHIEHSRYEDRYASGDRFAPRQRVWRVAEDNRELIYEPLDQPTRYTPR
ncbi:hypothetical protein A1O3_03900 [Capronia epimyces CBS 606.96]|uniref:DUF7892 domain-containing protein n=1 Tax=Capronia epimyces CBS 606.96 TaxID=1182542 RepID=W9YCH8_9EURO|nr:uncharacterized protein A1O3_03900 [Capronia epimyces CBS 606.96]EXJ86946.1 hypothetical protein A1O3_03900 [Capronia epimyces CBS 606.96]